MTNIVTTARGLALALVLVAIAAPGVANANMMIAAKDADGTVTAVDAEKGEFTLAGKTFAAARGDLRWLAVGAEVRVRYFETGTALMVIGVSSPYPRAMDATGANSLR